MLDASSAATGVFAAAGVAPVVEGLGLVEADGVVGVGPDETDGVGLDGVEVEELLGLEDGKSGEGPGGVDGDEPSPAGLGEDCGLKVSIAGALRLSPLDLEADRESAGPDLLISSLTTERIKSLSASWLMISIYPPLLFYINSIVQLILIIKSSIC